MNKLKICKAFALIVAVLLCFSACSVSESDTNGTKADTPDSIDLIDVDSIKVTFLELYETAGVEAAYLQLLVENKTDKVVWVYLDNVVVNGFEVMAASGIPMTIQPGAKSKNPFILSFQQFDASSVEEIKTIEFEVVEEDNDTSALIYRSARVSVPLSY